MPKVSRILVRVIPGGSPGPPAASLLRLLAMKRMLANHSRLESSSYPQENKFVSMVMILCMSTVDALSLQQYDISS